MLQRRGIDVLNVHLTSILVFYRFWKTISVILFHFIDLYFVVFAANELKKEVICLIKIINNLNSFNLI